MIARPTTVELSGLGEFTPSMSPGFSLTDNSGSQPDYQADSPSLSEDGEFDLTFNGQTIEESDYGGSSISPGELTFDPTGGSSFDAGFWGGIAKGATGLVGGFLNLFGAGNSNSKVPAMPNAAKVGAAGSTAGGIPTSYLLIGGGVAVAAILAVVLVSTSKK